MYNKYISLLEGQQYNSIEVEPSTLISSDLLGLTLANKKPDSKELEPDDPSDCPKKCNKHGLCFNAQCYCELGITNKYIIRVDGREMLGPKNKGSGPWDKENKLLHLLRTVSFAWNSGRQLKIKNLFYQGIHGFE